jgi:tetratricopeptide (TPR) repeat protein
MALCGALTPPLAQAASPQDETSEHMSLGLALIQAGQAQEALEEFQKAIELSPELASAHYYAGMALGQLQRFDASLEQFVAAAELDPGNGQAHLMACRTAYALQDYEEAWNQGIYAAQAGMDMSQAFAGLEEVSPRPTDFDARMSAPRVFVAELDLSRAMASGATPDSTTGSSTTIAFRLEDFVQARRQIGLSLVRSESFSVVQSPEQATYVLLVEIDDAEELSGLAKLIDTQTDEVVVMRPVTLPSSIGALRSVTDRLVGFFEEWLRNR